MRQDKFVKNRRSDKKGKSPSTGAVRTGGEGKQIKGVRFELKKFSQGQDKNCEKNFCGAETKDQP